MKKYILLYICLLALPMQAQEGWTLRQCIDYAIEHSIVVQQAENTAEQNAVDVNTAKWSRLPNLAGSAGQGWSWGRAASPVDNAYSDINTASTSLRVGTSIPLFTGLQIPNQYSYAKLSFLASIEDLNKAKEDISINVASSYLQVLFNWELHRVALSQVGLSQSQYSRLESMLEVGKAAPAEVAEAKARLAQDQMNAVQAENNYRLSLLDLSQLLELPTPEGFTLDLNEALPQFGPLTPPDEIYTDALINKPEIKAAALRLESSEKSIRIAQSAFYPQLSANADVSTSYYTVGGQTADGFGRQLKNNLNKYVGLSLSVPVFNRFATRNRVRAARLQQQNMALQLDNTKKVLYKEIQQAWYNAVAAESKYNSSSEAVIANQESFRLTSEKFDNGKSTLLEYDTAKQNLAAAESDQLQAKYDYLFRIKILDFYKGIPIH